MIRWLRVALTIVLIVAVLFDLQLFGMILQHGFPPRSILILTHTADGGFLLPRVTTGERVRWSLFLAGVGLVQIVIARVAWKAWHGPVTPDQN